MWRFMMALAVLGCGPEETGGMPEPSSVPNTDAENHIVLPKGTGGTSGITGDTGKTGGGLMLTDLQNTLHATYPTLALVTWNQSEAGVVRVEYSFDKDVWLSTPDIEGQKGANTQTVVGIPYATTAAWRVVGDDVSVDAAAPIVTGDPPLSLPTATVRLEASKAWSEDDRYLLTSVTGASGNDTLGWGTPGPFHTVILDRQGRVVWSRKTLRSRWTLYAQLSVSGDHIIYDDFPAAGNRDSAVAVRSYLDEVIEEVPIPGHHHAFIELPDGTLAWGSRSHGGGEALVEKAPGQLDETVVWSCSADFPAATSSCISNSLYYQAATDAYVYSFYTLEAVVAIDRSKGTTLWYAGKKVDPKTRLTFNPPESQFWWQHGVKLSPQGTLLVSTQDTDSGPSTIYGREYDVDLKKGELRETFVYDAQASAPTNGDIRRLANGHILHMVGSSGEIREVDAKGTTVWHLDFKQKGDNQRLLGRTEYVPDLYALLAPPTKAKR